MTLKDLLLEGAGLKTIYGTLKGDSGEDTTDAKEIVKLINKQSGYSSKLSGEDVVVTKAPVEGDELTSSLRTILKKGGKGHVEVSE